MSTNNTRETNYEISYRMLRFLQEHERKRQEKVEEERMGQWEKVRKDKKRQEFLSKWNGSKLGQIALHEVERTLM